MFKEICNDDMKKAFENIEGLKARKDQGLAYNYKDDKSEIHFRWSHRFPCPETVLVNSKHLERTFKFLKRLIKNQYSTDRFNDCVVIELKP